MTDQTESTGVALERWPTIDVEQMGMARKDLMDKLHQLTERLIIASGYQSEDAGSFRLDIERARRFAAEIIVQTYDPAIVAKVFEEVVADKPIVNPFAVATLYDHLSAQSVEADIPSPDFEEASFEAAGSTDLPAGVAGPKR